MAVHKSLIGSSPVSPTIKEGESFAVRVGARKYAVNSIHWISLKYLDS